MPRPPGVVRLVFSGTLAGGEVWSTGFWMTGTGVADSATAQAQARVIAQTLLSADASGAFRVTAAQLWSSSTLMLKVSCYAYTTPSGPAAFSGDYVLPAPLVGGVNNGNPNQAALVLSLRTNLAGRQHRGRMYLPATGVALTVDGQVPNAKVDTVLTAWRTAFHDINVSDAGDVVVVSTVGSSATPVNLLKMDSRIDIQRSRANKQAIAYQASQIIPV